MSNRNALVCIDLQVDFLDVDGRLPVDPAQAAQLLETVSSAVRTARHHSVPVVHVVNAFRRGSIANVFRGFAAIEGTPGAELDPRSPAPRGSEPVFAKRTGSAFSNPEFVRWLSDHGVDELLLCGVFAGGCVHATARSALALGHRVHVLDGGVADRSGSSRLRALRRMRTRGASVVSALPIDGFATGERV
ncbi:MAG: nicotinamidase-related amidase [Bradymonadia bacterium]|jgi:nicotinamidase-related amidase